MLTMPAPSKPRLHTWIDRGLAAGGHPTLDRIVKAGRRQTPPVGWAILAADISNKSGETVSYETLRQWFGHLDPKPEAVAE